MIALGIIFSAFTQNAAPDLKDSENNINNSYLITELNQKQSPLVAGLRTTHERSSHVGARCTLGMIVRSQGDKYLLTAGHCVTKGEDGIPEHEDIGLWVKQGDETIGQVYKIDKGS